MKPADSAGSKVANLHNNKYNNSAAQHSTAQHGR